MASNRLSSIKNQFNLLIPNFIGVLEQGGQAGSPPEPSLPVVFEATEDPSLNLTRSDINCDKTGTCYDGKRFFFNASTIVSLTR